jgi:hypothetical protein
LGFCTGLVTGWACFSAGAAGAGFAGGGLVVFFWSAPASIPMSIMPKSIITILVILAFDMFDLPAIPKSLVSFRETVPTVENGRKQKIPQELA